MMLIQQSASTATYRQALVYLLDGTDGVTPITGVATPDSVRVSKPGAAPANGTGAWTELEDGLYRYEFTATEVDTLGFVVLLIKHAGARSFVKEVEIVAFDPMAATNLGLTALPTFGPGTTNGLPRVQDLGETDNLANLDVAVSTRLAPTVAGRTLDVTVDGESGIDWGNIGNQSATPNLGGTLNNVNNVGTVTTTTNVTNPVVASNVSADVAAELVAIRLNELIAVAATGVVQTDSIIGTIIQPAGQVFSRTTDSLLAIRDRGDAAWATAAGFSTHSAADVWAVATRTITGGTIDALADDTITTLSIADGALTTAKFATSYYDDIQNRADQALKANRLDELLITPTTGDPAVGTFFGDLLEDNAGTYRFTAAALALAPTGGGGSDPAIIAAAVWDRQTSLSTLPGSFGQRTQGLDSGTAQAGAASTLTLRSGASSIGNYYVNGLVHITAGTGVGQVRRISGYDGLTKIATVSPNWLAVPSSASQYVILPAGETAAAGSDPSAIADAVWDEDIVAAHGTASTAGFLLRILGADIATRTFSNTLEALLGVPDSQRSPSFSDPNVGDAVWRALSIDNWGGGSYGQLVTQIPIRLTDILDNTDRLTFNAADRLLVDIREVNDVNVTSVTDFRNTEAEITSALTAYGAALESSLDDIKGVGFVSGTDSLRQIRIAVSGIDSSATAAAVWAEALPGSYTGGQAGGLLGQAAADAASILTWNATLPNIRAQVDQALNQAIPATPDASIDVLSVKGRLRTLDELTAAGGAGDLAAILGNTSILGDPIPELGVAPPPATPTLAQAVMLPYMALRNRVSVGVNTKKLYNSLGNNFVLKAISDDGSFFNENIMVAGDGGIGP